MAIKPKRKDDRLYLVDHDTFGDVYRCTYKEGTITDFGVEKTDPFTLNDTCTVELQGGGIARNVPIFYHCRKGYYDDQVATLRLSGALRGGARAFRTGQKVQVMMYDDANAQFVMGHNEGTRPKACQDIFKMRFYGWEGRWHEIHYCVSQQKEYGGLDQAMAEPDGRPLKLTKKQRRLFGFREVQGGTVVQYYGDWLIVVGPLMLIFRVASVGMPGPNTGWVKIYAGIWTKEREEEAIAIGKEKEAKLPTGIWGYMNPMDFEIDYPGTYLQTPFTNVLNARFKGYTLPQPRWIYTEFYTQDWEA